MTNSTEIASYPSERRNSQSSGALPSVEYGLIRAHVFASLVTLVVSVLFGLLLATHFPFPASLPRPRSPPSPTLRYHHTHAIFLRWLRNPSPAFFSYPPPPPPHPPAFTPH